MSCDYGNPNGNTACTAGERSNCEWEDNECTGYFWTDDCRNYGYTGVNSNSDCI